MLALIGLSFRQTPVDLLARLAADDAVPRAIDSLTEGPDPALHGAVVLTTCNRFEVYLDAARFHDTADAVTAAFDRGLGIAASAGSAASAASVASAASAAELTCGPSVARHLFRVAAGLDSMVVGEAEISGQVAAALRAAQRDGLATTPLNLLFQSAARTAKHVATATDLGAAGRSLAGVALDRAAARAGSLAAASVLVIGTGSYARVVVAALKARGCTAISSYSRSGRQTRFAADRGLAAVAEEDLPAALRAADLVVTCSGTGEAVLTRATVDKAVAGRETPLIIVDLAARGDVPADARDLDGVRIVTLADLTAEAADPAGGTTGTTADPAGGTTGATAGPAGVAAATIDAAEAIVDDAVDTFVDEIAARTLDPAIVALRTHITSMIDAELADLKDHLPADAAPAVERSLHRIARTLLHTPTVRARALARDGHGDDYVEALHTLFGIDASSPVG